MMNNKMVSDIDIDKMCLIHNLTSLFELEFYSCINIRVSCIRVLAAIIVVYVFSCINKACFIFSCMYFRVPIKFLIFRVCIFGYQYIFLFFWVYFVYLFVY